jgi:acyl carrier protein
MKEPSESVLAHIQVLIEKTLQVYIGNLSNGHKVDLSCSMSSIGMDSLMGMEVRGKLSKVLDLPISMNAFQEHNSIQSLAIYMHGLISSSCD